MSNNSAQEKTEDATPQKLRKSREDGQVTRSKDLATTVSLIATLRFSRRERVAASAVAMAARAALPFSRGMNSPPGFSPCISPLKQVISLSISPRSHRGGRLLGLP